MWKLTILSILLAANCAWASSESVGVSELDTALGEEIIFISLQLPEGAVKLQTTVYHPKGIGMHPLVIINHGANGKLRSYHEQERFRPLELARFFTARGYIVAVPMREGFAESTGNCYFRCNHAEYALFYKRDIDTVIQYFISSGSANPQQVLVIGQSNGGIVTLGYAASTPIAKAIINISGGINTERPGCDWVAGMMNAAMSLGAESKIPSLWMYAKDDQIFPLTISKPFYEAYITGGGKAMISLFSSGGHGFALRRGSQKFWGPDVTGFLETVGLPFEVWK